MAPLNIVEARLAAFFTESVLFGTYLVSFSYTLLILATRDSGKTKFSKISCAMVIIVLIMFYNATMNSATSVVIFWRAFVLAPPGSAEESFRQITNWAVVMKSAVLLFQTTIGDGMLIYRCWVLYHRSLLPVAFSIVLWLGGTACSIATIYLESTSKEHVLVSAKALFPFSVSFWVSTLVLNIITTSLIVLPIWRVARNGEDSGLHSEFTSTNKIRFVIQVIIESGLLYTTVACMTFVTYTAKSNALYIMSDALVPTAGIAFNLIIIRTSRNREDTSTRSGIPTTIGATRPPFKRSHTMLNSTAKNVDEADDGHIRVLVSQNTLRDSYSGTYGGSSIELNDLGFRGKLASDVEA